MIAWEAFDRTPADPCHCPCCTNRPTIRQRLTDWWQRGEEWLLFARHIPTRLAIAMLALPTLALVFAVLASGWHR